MGHYDELVQDHEELKRKYADLTARLETTELALRDKAFEASDTAIKLAKAEMQLAEANEWYAKSQAYTTEVQKELATANAQVKRLGEAGFNTIRHKNGYNKFSNFLRSNDKDGERQCWVNWELVTGELLSVLNDIPEYKAALAKEGREEK
jgi:exonuclease VII small subunit